MDDQIENVSMATLEEEIDDSGNSMLDLVKGQNSADQNAGTKIKVKSLDALVTDGFINQGTMSDVTIGDIVEHGDLVSSDESGVMHLKISNVVTVDESITGCTISDEDKESFANIQIASVGSLLEDDQNAKKDGVDFNVSQPSEMTPITTENDPNAVSLKIVDFASIKQTAIDASSSTNSSEVLLPPDVHQEMRVISFIRSSLVIPRVCQVCNKKSICEYRILCKGDVFVGKSRYVCSTYCKSVLQITPPPKCAVEKPKKYFERCCGMCGNEIHENKKGLFSWETREFCNKLCLADHIGYVGQKCRQCQSSVKLLHMGKYCVRFGSDIYQFCSNLCLERYKKNIQVCSYCQKNLLNLPTKEQSHIIPVNSSKKYCSQKCLKRALRKDINQQFYRDRKSCTVCTKSTIPRFEFLKEEETSFLCSQPCLNVYKFANDYKAVNCCLCLRLLCVENVIFFLHHNNGQLRVFCSTSCTNVFILSTRRIVMCNYCKVKKYNFDMILMHDETNPAHYCSVCCLNIDKPKVGLEEIQDITSVPSAENSATNTTINTAINLPLPQPPLALPSAFAARDMLSIAPQIPPMETTPITDASKSPGSSITTTCNMCSSVSAAQFHMVMSDNTLRNFCSYNCASKYKNIFGYLVSQNADTNKLSDTVVSVAAVTSPAVQMPPPQTTPTLPKTRISMLSGASKDVTKRTTSPIPIAKKDVKPAINLSDLMTKLKELAPKEMKNKSTMCKPANDEQGAITRKRDLMPPFIPIPFPVYVPTPVMMYSIPTPFPIMVPIPTPVPIVIPTTHENTEKLIKSIRNIHTRLEFSKTPSPRTIDELEGVVGFFNRAITSHCEEHMDTNRMDTDQTEKMDTDEKEKTDVTEKEKVSFGLLAWQNWLNNLQKGDVSVRVTQKLEDMNEKELSVALSKLFEDLRTSNGEKCRPDTVFYIAMDLQKQLQLKNLSWRIFLDQSFTELNETLNYIFASVIDEVMMSRLTGVTKPTTRILEEDLWYCGLLGSDNAMQLLNTIFYLGTKYLRLKTVEDHLKLTFSLFKTESDIANEETVLKYCSPLEEPTEIKENKTNLDRCPVKLFKKYFSKCPDVARKSPRKLFYYLPECSLSQSSLHWYSAERYMSRDTMQWYINRNMLVQEVLQRY